jgi:hypothetical protein
MAGCGRGYADVDGLCWVWSIRRFSYALTPNTPMSQTVLKWVALLVTYAILHFLLRRSGLPGWQQVTLAIVFSFIQGVRITLGPLF